MDDEGIGVRVMTIVAEVDLIGWDQPAIATEDQAHCIATLDIEVDAVNVIPGLEMKMQHVAAIADQEAVVTLESGQANIVQFAIGLNSGIEEMTRAWPSGPHMDSRVVVPDRVTKIPAGVQVVRSTLERSWPGEGRSGEKTAANQGDTERASELL